MNVKVMVCYHKDTPRLRSDVLFPIHVGRALASEELKAAMADMPGDDTGDNISEKNASYNELTALYWSWKNPALLGSPDYIGLCHYRRLLSVPLGRGLRARLYKIRRECTRILAQLGSMRWLAGMSTDAIREVCGQYDIIVPSPFTMDLTMREHYVAFHVESDLDEALSIVHEKYPLMPISEVMNSTSVYFCNIAVMRADLWNEYSAWLFDVLFELERHIDADVQRRKNYQHRAYAFLGERLFNIWLSYKKEADASIHVGELPFFPLRGI
ncbi:MAG: DUF4422 domain-containing protein [Synergistaceae bacterium]|jgi:hypothetical protein|nr:DUF4422 domain-containing protein [Synergistaceae bacterium]